MLFSLFTSLVDQYSFLNVFRYLTFRTGLAVITSLVVVFIIGGPLIKLFSEKMIAGPIRQDGPIDHIIKKSGTPTMGGVIIIIGIISGTILWSDLSNIYVWTLIFVALSLGALGLLDDVLKIKFKNSQGLKSRYKFLGQIIIGLITLLILIKYSNHEFLFNLYFPFFKNLIWHMGLFFIPFGLFVIIGVLLGTTFAAMAKTKSLIVFFTIVVFCLGTYLLINSNQQTISKNKFRLHFRIIFGLISGFISAPMGIGGAVMNVPILKYFGYPIKKAIGSAATIGFIIALCGAIGFWYSGLVLKVNLPLSVGFINVPAFLIFIPITMFMARVGANYAHKIDKTKLQVFFGIFLYVVGTVFVYRYSGL